MPITYPITHLPPPDSPNKGWPWKAHPLPCRIDNNWPRISIVTPSFNHGKFVEETIRSVLLQNYPNLEYIIIDGGSTDNSVEIIKKYEPWLSHWESKPDKGQSHAINKGFKHATGEIFGWLNSDDIFLPNALVTLMLLREAHPRAVAWVGGCTELHSDGKKRNILPRLGTKEDFGAWGIGAHFYQPSCLFRADLFAEAGGLKENLHYVMDIDLWMILLNKGSFAATNKIISAARITPDIKTLRDIPAREAEKIAININNNQHDAAKQTLSRYASSQFYQNFCNNPRIVVFEASHQFKLSAWIKINSIIIIRKITSFLKRNIKNIYWIINN